VVLLDSQYIKLPRVNHKIGSYKMKARSASHKL